MIDVAALLKDHLYIAIVLGSLVEGETTVVLAGFAAHQGYAPFATVALLGAVMNFCWDQLYFWLGRTRSDWMMRRFPALARGVMRVTPMINRHRLALIILVRFLYGLRTAGPFALGLAGIPWGAFLVLNAIGALVWAFIFAGLGYLFGRAIATAIGEIARYEAEALAVIIAIGVAVGVVHWIRSRRRLRAGR